MILRLTHDLSGLKELNFATLCLEIGDIPTVRLAYFLDQFISTFNARNCSVKFQDLKLSTKKLLANYLEMYSIWQTTFIILPGIFILFFHEKSWYVVCRAQAGEAS